MMTTPNTAILNRILHPHRLSPIICGKANRVIGRQRFVLYPQPFRTYSRTNHLVDSDECHCTLFHVCGLFAATCKGKGRVPGNINQHRLVLRRSSPFWTCRSSCVCSFSVNICSISGVMSGSSNGQFSYAASKAGIFSTIFGKTYDISLTMTSNFATYPQSCHNVFGD